MAAAHCDPACGLGQNFLGPDLRGWLLAGIPLAVLIWITRLGPYR